MSPEQLGGGAGAPWESPVWVAGLGGRDPQAQGSNQVNPGAMEGCLWGEPQKVFWVWLPRSSIPGLGLLNLPPDLLYGRSLVVSPS